MAFEAILVPAGLLAHLTVPSQLVEPLGFLTVVDPFRSAHVVLAHRDGRVVEALFFGLYADLMTYRPCLCYVWSRRWSAVG